MAIKISIVIPTFRRPALLRQCIGAVVNQQFPMSEYEIIVISDGPDEETARIVNEIEDEYAYFPSVNFDFLPVKKGPAAARNKGWRQARGELIAFTDDDCIPGECWLKKIWGAYLKNRNTAFTGKIHVPCPQHPTDYEHNVALLEKADFVTANCFCPLHVLEQVGGFDERFSIAWREDSDLEFKLLQNDIEISHIENVSIIHPVRKAAWGVSLREQHKSMFNALLYKKYPALYRKKIQRMPPWNYYAIIISFFGIWMGMFFPKSHIIMISLIIWLFLTAQFIAKRLSGSSMEIKHVAEMVVTSFLIPFFSVFWRLYGAVKYKVWFL